ncbi:MAG: hypothetical protein Q4B09_06815 [Lachnospiraceae bacterium]|nr:hypothetical protein [Lachnospiraceae bacterium]
MSRDAKEKEQVVETAEQVTVLEAEAVQEPSVNGAETKAEKPASLSGDKQEPAAAAYDFHDAMIQIEMLFQSHILSFGYKEYSLETYADKRFFADWKAREGCEDTDEMRAGLNIDGILRSADPSESEVLTYAQYTLNIAELCRRSFNREDAQGYDFDIRNYTELLSRIREILKKLHHEVKYVPEKEFIFLVPHDAAAEAASEDESDPLSRAITEYRSSSLVGQLDAKRELLAEMGRRIETYPDNLKKNNSYLYSRIEFMLNHIHIRENNMEGEERVDRVAAMSRTELEQWYDETYQLLLLRILEHQNAERLQEVDRLASECGIGISSISEEEIASLMNGELPELEEETNEDDKPEEEKTPKQKSGGRKEQPAASGEEEQAVQADHHTRNVIAAVVIADILFVLFVLWWVFVIKGV